MAGSGERRIGVSDSSRESQVISMVWNLPGLIRWGRRAILKAHVRLVFLTGPVIDVFALVNLPGSCGDFAKPGAIQTVLSSTPHATC